MKKFAMIFALVAFVTFAASAQQAAVPTPNKGSVTPVATMKVTPKPVNQTNVPAATTPACCQKGGASAAGCSKTCTGDAKAATPASCAGHANGAAPKTCDHTNAPAAVPAKTTGQ
jgi:hypothetical protein